MNNTSQKIAFTKKTDTIPVPINPHTTGETLMSALPGRNIDDRKSSRVAVNVQAKIFVGISPNFINMNGIIHFNTKGASIYLPETDVNNGFTKLKEKTKCYFQELILFSEIGTVTINNLYARYLRQTHDNYGDGIAFDFYNTNSTHVDMIEKALELLEGSNPVDIVQKKGLSLLPIE